MAWQPQPLLWERKNGKIHPGNLSASVQTPRSLKLPLLCSSIRIWESSAPFHPPAPQLSLGPRHSFPFCARAHTPLPLRQPPSLPPGFGLPCAARSEPPASPVPWRKGLALCLPADLLPGYPRNSMTAALTVEGCKWDHGEEISFIRTTQCVLNCVL